MKITCESCGAKYTIADDKVRGRKVKIRCKGCGTPIVVDGKQSNGATAETDDDAGLDSETPAALEAAPAGSDVEWSVNLSETDQRTLTTQQLVEGWRGGTITADAYVWREGMGDWLPILECAELEPKLRAGANGAAQASPRAATEARVASAPGAAARPFGSSAARIAPRRTSLAQDLFAGVESAGADGEELATSAPALPQPGSVRPPAADDRMTGARNENSVLFSLDALKAGFSGAPVKAEPAPKDRSRPSAKASNDDPFGMGAPSSVAGIGGGNNPLFSLAANQALLTAPPPPEPPPRPVQALIASGPQPAAAPRSKKTLVAFGVGAVALLAAGLGLGLGLGGDKDKDAEGPSSAASAEARADERSDDSKGAEPKKDVESAEAKTQPSAPVEPQTEEAKTDAAKTDAAKTDAAKTEAGTPAESSSAEGKTVGTKSGTSSGSSSSSKREPKEAAKKEEPKPAAGADQPFSKAAAVTALTNAASQSSSCKKIGGPTGTGKVTVTFAPSGRVTSANVNGAPFAGTTVGGCVASVFRKAKVPAFSGNPLTVSKSFTIR